VSRDGLKEQDAADEPAARREWLQGFGEEVVAPLSVAP
jgi:hypothetical protein